MSTQNKSFFSFGMAVFFAFILNLLIERQVGAFDPDEQSELMELRTAAKRVLDERTIEVLSRNSTARIDYQDKIEKLFLKLGTLTGLNTAESPVRLSRRFHVDLLGALFKEQGVLFAVGKKTSDVLLRMAQNRAFISLIKERIKKYWPQEEVLRGSATADIERLEALDEQSRASGSEGFIAPAGIKEQKTVTQTIGGLFGYVSSRAARACEATFVDTRGLAALSVSPRDIRPVLEILDTLYAASRMLRQSLGDSTEIKAINPSLTLTFRAINTDDRDSTLNAWGYTFLLATRDYFGETIRAYPEYKQSLELKRHEEEKAEHERLLRQKRLEQQRKLLEDQERYQRTLQEQQKVQEVSAAASAPADASEPAASSSAASAQEALPAQSADDEAEQFAALVQQEALLYQTQERLGKVVNEEMYALIEQLAGVSSFEEKVREVSASFNKLMELSDEETETDAVYRNRIFQEANYSAQLKTFEETLTGAKHRLIENHEAIHKFITSTPESSEPGEYYTAYGKYIKQAEFMFAELESAILQARQTRQLYDERLHAINASIDEIKRVFDDRIDRIEEISLINFDDFTRGLEKLRADNEHLSRIAYEERSKRERLEQELREKDQAFAAEERLKIEHFNRELKEKDEALAAKRFDEELDTVSRLQTVVREILPFDVLAGLIQKAFQRVAEVFKEEDPQEMEEYLEEEQDQMPSVISAIQQEVTRFFAGEHERIIAPLERVRSVMREITSPVPELDEVLRQVEELIEAHQKEITRVVLDPVRTTADRLPEALPALVHAALVNHLVYNRPLDVMVGAIQHSQRLVQDAPDMIDTYHRNNNTSGKQAATALRTIASQVGTLSSAVAAASFSTSNSEVSAGNGGGYKDLFNDLAEKLEESQRALAALPRKVSAEILRRLEPVRSHHTEVMQPKRTRVRSTTRSDIGGSAAGGTLLEVNA